MSKTKINITSIKVKPSWYIEIVILIFKFTASIDNTLQLNMTKQLRFTLKMS